MSATLTRGCSLGPSRGINGFEGGICTIGSAAANHRVSSDGIGHRRGTEGIAIRKLRSTAHLQT